MDLQHQPERHEPGPRPAVRPPTASRGEEPYLSVEVGARLVPDDTVPLKVSAAAIDSPREAWTAICGLHEAELAKASPLTPGVACQVKARKAAFATKQHALARADAARAEIRPEAKKVEAAIAQKTALRRGTGDTAAAAAVTAAEVRGWLRAAPTGSERLALVERAIAAGDARVVGAVLELPMIAGLGSEEAAVLGERWQRRHAPEELARLQVLARVQK